MDVRSPIDGIEYVKGHAHKVAVVINVEEGDLCELRQRDSLKMIVFIDAYCCDITVQNREGQGT